MPKGMGPFGLEGLLSMLISEDSSKILSNFGIESVALLLSGKKKKGTDMSIVDFSAGYFWESELLVGPRFQKLDDGWIWGYIMG